VFRRESPRGRVLRPDPGHVHDYAPADWEDRIARLPLVTPVREADRLPPREIVVGLVAGGAARAIPQRELESAGALEDVVGGVPILVVLGEDGRSLRAFDRRVDGRALDFARAPAGPWALDDRETGSRWDFTGTAVSGPLAGRRLGKVAPLRDYWFDWEKYHPRTTVFPDPVAR